MIFREIVKSEEQIKDNLCIGNPSITSKNLTI